MIRSHRTRDARAGLSLFAIGEELAESTDDMDTTSDMEPLIADHIDITVPNDEMDHASDISAPKPTDNLGPQFEEILMHLGGNGRYQKYIVFLVLLPMCFASSIMASAWVRNIIINLRHFAIIISLNVSSDSSL